MVLAEEYLSGEVINTEGSYNEQSLARVVLEGALDIARQAHDRQGLAKFSGVYLTGDADITRVDNIAGSRPMASHKIWRDTPLGISTPSTAEQDEVTVYWRGEYESVSVSMTSRGGQLDDVSSSVIHSNGKLEQVTEPAVVDWYLAGALRVIKACNV